MKRLVYLLTLTLFAGAGLAYAADKPAVEPTDDPVALGSDDAPALQPGTADRGRRGHARWAERGAWGRHGQQQGQHPWQPQRGQRGWRPQLGQGWQRGGQPRRNFGRLGQQRPQGPQRLRAANAIPAGLRAKRDKLRAEQARLKAERDVLKLALENQKLRQEIRALRKKLRQPAKAARSKSL